MTLSGLGHTVSKLMQLQTPAGKEAWEVGVLGFIFISASSYCCQLSDGKETTY